MIVESLDVCGELIWDPAEKRRKIGRALDTFLIDARGRVFGFDRETTDAPVSLA